MSDQIKQVVETLNRDWEEFKREHQKSLKESDTLLNEKVDRINEGLTGMSEKMTALEKQAKLDDLRSELGELKEYVHSDTFKVSKGKDEHSEHVKAFFDYVRNPRDGAKADRLEELQQKDVTIGTDSAGGYAVPAPIAQEIFKKIIDISPVVSAVRNTPVKSTLYERLVDVRGASSGWAGETTTRSETSEPTLAQVTFTHGELYAVAKASNWALTDMMFDVENWLTDAVADEFAYQLGAAITTGNGSNKPTGMVGTPSATDDDGASPERAFGTIQYVPTGRAGGFQNDQFGSPQGHPFDCFLTLFSKFKPAYLNNAQFMMRRATEATLRKMHDADRNYFWSPSVSAGLPNTLFGYNILPNENVAAIAADSISVLFGDFRAGYELIRLPTLGMIRDNVTAKGHHLFYFSQRWGGKVVNDDAIKSIKMSAS